MCVPLALAGLTTAQTLTAISLATSAIGFVQRQRAEKAEYKRQQQQNEIARNNAIKRYASESLRIRQVQQQSAEKELEGVLQTRKKEAEFITVAGARGLSLTGSTNRLLEDYYRTQGNYTASLERNMNINVAQYRRNLDAIQFGQESQSTYVTPPNPILNFASSAMNVANSHYGRKYEKEFKYDLQDEF